MQNDREFSEPFDVTNGAKQGCVMAPTLFSMMSFAMLMNAFQDSDIGFSVRYFFDCNIFNLRRLQAKTKVQTDVIDKLLYADNMDKNAGSARRQKCKELWTKSYSHVITIISQSEANQHLETVQ